MIEALWFFFEMFSNALDQFLFLFLINHQLPEQKPNRIRDVSALLVFTSLLTGMQQLNLPYVVSFSGMFAFHLTYSLVFRNGTLWQRVLWPAIARFTFYVINQAITLFLAIIPGYNYQAMMEQTPQRFLAVCFYMFISTMVFFLLSRVGPRKRNLPLRTQLASVAMAVICIIFAGAIFDFSPAALEHEASVWVVNISCVGFMLSTIAWLFILDSLSTQNAEVLALQAENQRMESEQRYAVALDSSYERLAEFRHDLKNQILSLVGFAERDDFRGLKDQLELLHGKIDPDELLMLTKYPAIDALISIKLKEASELHIETEALLIAPDLLPMDTVDFCSILGNILDNAIEAARQVPTEQRYLRLFAEPAGGMWHIRLKNSSTGKYRRDDDVLLTTKQGACHGIGLRRVIKLTEQSGGYVLLNPGPSSFTVDIFLPWPAMEEE